MINTSSSMLYHINNLNTENARISMQMSTGDKISKGSEDSILYSDIIGIEDKQRVTEGLKLQIANTQAMNDVSDSNMKEIKAVLGTGTNTVQEDLLKALNAGMDRSDKLALATNLKGIRETLYDNINTSVGGEYLFTGSDTSVRTMSKDDDFANNGKVEFDGDGFLREVAVQPGSYRDRGITAYDAVFYTSSKANAGESFTFEEGERIIDENGFEWKLNADETQLQKYDYNGHVYHPLNDDASLGAVTAIDIDISKTTTPVEATTTNQAVQKTFTINNIGSSPTGKVFEAKHNYFDDLNVIINALEGQSTKLDGTKGGEINDELVRSTVSNGLEQTSKQFDASNVGHGELGGRNAIFNAAENKLSTQSSHYNILMQTTNGVDQAQALIESKALEITYQSLYSTINKMSKLSLLNYLN